MYVKWCPYACYALLCITYDYLYAIIICPICVLDTHTNRQFILLPSACRWWRSWPGRRRRSWRLCGDSRLEFGLWGCCPVYSLPWERSRDTDQHSAVHAHSHMMSVCVWGYMCVHTSGLADMSKKWRVTNLLEAGETRTILAGYETMFQMQRLGFPNFPVFLDNQNDPLMRTDNTRGQSHTPKHHHRVLRTAHHPNNVWSVMVLWFSH